MYDNVPDTDTTSSARFNANDEDNYEKKIVTPRGSPVGSTSSGVKEDDLDDSGLSHQEVIMQDNMQDIEDRKLSSPELGTDSSYVELGSPAAYTRMSPIEKSVEATVSETERNGNQQAGLVQLGSSSRESLSAGSCDSNANIKSVPIERIGITRTYSDTQCIAPDILAQHQVAHSTPNRTENGELANDSMTPGTPSSRVRLRSDSEPESQDLFARVERRSRKSSRINPAISLSVQSVNDAMSPHASPSHSPMGTPQMQRPKSTGTLMLSFIDRKVQEILDTERSYVKDLGDITQVSIRAFAEIINIINFHVHEHQICRVFHRRISHQDATHFAVIV